MPDYNLIKKLEATDLTEGNKPKIDYRDFEVIVEGRVTTIGIPIREGERFKAILSEGDSFTRRKFRGIMREFRGIRK